MSPNKNKSDSSINCDLLKKMLASDEIYLRVRAIIVDAELDIKNFNKLDFKYWEQMKLYGSKAKIPVADVVYLSISSGASLEWLFTGKITSSKDYIWHGSYLKEKMNWLLEKINIYKMLEDMDYISFFQAEFNETLFVVDEYNQGKMQLDYISDYYENDDVCFLPRYDVKLSTVDGIWVDRIKRIEHISFLKEDLTKITKGKFQNLIMLSVQGDAMEPTIKDGAKLIIEVTRADASPGIWAFALGNDLKIRRVEWHTDYLKLISDNSFYPVEEVDEMNEGQLQWIGKVKWVGQSI